MEFGRGKLAWWGCGIVEIVRLDHLAGMYTVPPYYDSMVSKIIVSADNRNNCITRSKRVLGETVVGGIQTNLELHKQILNDPEFVEGHFSTNYLSKKLV